MTIESIVRNIIDHHNQNDSKKIGYWHEKLNLLDSDKAKDFINQMDHNNHHVGDFYRKNGLRIDIQKKSSESTNLLKVMNFIVAGLKNDDGSEQSISLEKQIFFERDIKDDFESELVQYKQIYGDNKGKSRDVNGVCLLEEMEIKAIAVSILAETNGSIKMAQDILTFAGLKIIKSMKVDELKNLSSTLKALSTQTDINDNHPSRGNHHNKQCHQR